MWTIVSKNKLLLIFLTIAYPIFNQFLISFLISPIKYSGLLLAFIFEIPFIISLLAAMIGIESVGWKKTLSYLLSFLMVLIVFPLASVVGLGIGFGANADLYYSLGSGPAILFWIAATILIPINLSIRTFSIDRELKFAKRLLICIFVLSLMQIVGVYFDKYSRDLSKEIQQKRNEQYIAEHPITASFREHTFYTSNLNPQISTTLELTQDNLPTFQKL